jgi:hypothetical protein
VLQAPEARKVLRASLDFLESKASPAKMVPSAPVAFRARAAAADPKAAMEKTVPRECLVVPERLAPPDRKVLLVTRAPLEPRAPTVPKALQESRAQLARVVYQAWPDPLEYRGKKVNLVLQVSVVVPAALEEMDWKAPPAIKVLQALQAPTAPLASVAQRAVKVPRATLVLWATLVNPVAMERLALPERLAWRALLDLQVSSCCEAYPWPFFLTLDSQVNQDLGATTARMVAMVPLADVDRPVKWVSQAPAAPKVKSAPRVRMAGCTARLARLDPQGMIKVGSETSNKPCFFVCA